jgi:hypothetical protein
VVFSRWNLEGHELLRWYCAKISTIDGNLPPLDDIDTRLFLLPFLVRNIPVERVCDLPPHIPLHTTAGKLAG